MIYDVIICGAGPAGSSAGYELAKNGLNVLIIDKEYFPRIKNCAGGIRPYLLKNIPGINNIIENKIFNIRFSYKGTNTLSVKYNEPIVLIMRKEFDMLLLERAKNQNAIFKGSETLINATIKNDFIEIQTTKKLYKTKYLIGADGALSSVNRIFNIVRKNPGLTINTEIKLRSTAFEKFKNTIFIETGEFNNGYLWSFPKKNHITAGMIIIKNKYKNLKSEFFRYLKNINLYHQDIKKIIYLKGAPITTFNNKEKLNKENVLLIGEAANLVDCFNGEGIYYAMESGKIAAQSIIDKENNNIPVDNYNMAISEISDTLEQTKKTTETLYKNYNYFSPDKILKIFYENF